MAERGSLAYEARYGWNGKTIRGVVISAVFTGLLLLPGMPLYARILGLPLFGGGALFMTYVARSHKVAFRVDDTGVLLGGSPARYGATTVHVPWDDITGFVLWRQVTGKASVPYVGVSRREGAPALPGDGPRSRAVLSALTPVPADIAIASRAVTGWRLDQERLVSAVAHFAPGVPVTEYPRA
ncbi:hypothetical protein ACH47Z_32955 [Streptomyces sp. NPDC020192]|uniref:hypothetical protein n=1 Tax=Streptomyces sp. NPDC020192 TaxID=3365066 RepID=UPI0037A41906